MSTLRLAVQPIAIAIALALAVRASSIGIYSIPSPSMAPTLQVGDTILVTPYLSGAHPARGDVVVFRSPSNPDEMVVKRVIATPGDLIETRDGQVVICGRTIAEPYTRGLPTGALAPQIIAGSSYFVLGDNRPNSYDSRLWGPIAERSIVGRARLVLWSGIAAPEANATALTAAGGTHRHGLRVFQIVR